MLRKLCDISDMAGQALVGQKMTVVEKLDMVYFKVRISKDGIHCMRTPSFREISEIDILCNEMYRDMVDFADYLYGKHGDEILDKYGDDTVIGLFYLPAVKTRVISYDRVGEYSYIYSDCNKQSFDDICINDIVMGRPWICKDVVFTSDMLVLRHKPVEFINFVTEGNGYTWSGNDVKDIEGVVLEFPSAKYQVIVNDCDLPVDKFSTKTYRDMILNDFANTILIGEKDYVDSMFDDALQGVNGYVDMISRVFCEYMHMTDIFTRMDISAEDLVPPHIGFFGKMCVDDIAYSTAKFMCKHDERAANVLRIFLYAFNRKSDFKDFSERQSAALRNFYNLMTKITNNQ